MLSNLSFLFISHFIIVASPSSCKKINLWYGGQIMLGVAAVSCFADTPSPKLLRFHQQCGICRSTHMVRMLINILPLLWIIHLKLLFHWLYFAHNQSGTGYVYVDVSVLALGLVVWERSGCISLRDKVDAGVKVALGCTWLSCTVW